FCQQVRQVRFNAWHYVDTNLWASLAATLFDELARPATPDATEAKLAQLDEAREKERDARERRQDLELEVQELAADTSRAAAAVASAVPVAIHAARRDSLRQDLRAVQDPKSKDYDVIRLANVLGQLDGAAVRARTVWRLFREEVRYRRTWATLVTLLVFVGGAVLAWVLGSWSTGPKVLALAAGLIAGFTPALAGVQQVLHLAKEAREARELPLVRAQEELARAQAREQDAGQEIVQRERELAKLRDKGLQLQEFVRERAASSDYRDRLGVISQVRRDFEHLVALVPGSRPAAAEQVVAVAAAVAEQVPNVDRIVLYVDDLDRCPHQKVVEVLQAVHLLLAFKLFVVVVGVDSRWLERSLEAHYQDLLDEPGSYLEKIFQIPFILQRMTPARYRDLVEGLAPAVAEPAEPEPTGPHSADALRRTTDSSQAQDGSHAMDVSQEPNVSQGANVSEEPGPDPGPGPDPTPRPDPVPEPAPARAVLPPLPRPEALVITGAERALLGDLGGIVPTPRAAKRLVNIYRMLRVSVPEDELEAFRPGGGDEYQAVVLLLAILVGRPAEAGDIFAALRAASDDTDVWQVLGGFDDAAAALAAVRRQLTVTGAGPYRRWVPRVARFSFRLGAVPPLDDW
ncbi:MAG: P-loop NTPase fold protein, partial [Actinomycetota bacterium]